MDGLLNSIILKHLYIRKFSDDVYLKCIPESVNANTNYNKGSRYATANINMNVIITSEIITSEVPKNTFKKNFKISYNIFSSGIYKNYI